MPRMLKSTAGSSREGRPREFLEVLARGLRIFEAFRDSKRPLTLSEVASFVDIPRASARRALLTLTELHFVENDGRFFRLTPHVLTLASAYLATDVVPNVMQPIVERLSRETEEACSAAVLDGDDVVFVARANPQRIVSVGLEIGYRLPASATAVGRVLLSALSNEQVDEHLRRANPQRLTDRSIVNKKRLREIIVAARRDGYSAADQEVESGFRSIAVPVLRPDGKTACALHIGTHVVAMPLDHALQSLLPVLRKAAKTASPMLI
jgi:IclR family pca regulon transcriptional regulator